MSEAKPRTAAQALAELAVIMCEQLDALWLERMAAGGDGDIETFNAWTDARNAYKPVLDRIIRSGKP